MREGSGKKGLQLGERRIMKISKKGPVGDSSSENVTKNHFAYLRNKWMIMINHPSKSIIRRPYRSCHGNYILSRYIVCTMTVLRLKESHFHMKREPVEIIDHLYSLREPGLTLCFLYFNKILRINLNNRDKGGDYIAGLIWSTCFNMHNALQLSWTFLKPMG